MTVSRIAHDNKSGVYFVTPTVWNWYYIFDRHDRWQILADSLRFLQDNKGLKIHAYVFMLNHLHLIIESDDVAACLRDFKRHTSREIKRNISQTEPQLLPLFTNDTGQFHFWKPDNQPKMLETEKFYLQKLNYLHNNPVQKGYVDKPENWKWSSANPNSPIKIADT